METDKCKCGEESTRGCHGIKDSEIYDEYYCDDCYNKKSCNKEIDKLESKKIRREHVERKASGPSQVSDGTKEQVGIEKCAS